MKIYEALKKVLKKYRNYEDGSIDYENAKTILKNDKKAILVDVRSKQEYNEGHLEGSINIALYDLERGENEELKDKEATIILYCQTSGRSNRALQILKKKGYHNVYQIEGGLDNIGD